MAYRLVWKGPDVDRVLRRRLVGDLTRMGREIRAKARENCPVDTGQLRDSIVVVADARNLRITIGSDIKYAIYQELGTSSGVPATNFMGRAIDEVTSTFHFST